MRILALGVLMLAVGGCATAAEQEMTRMADTVKRAVAVADDCWSRAQAQDGYVALGSRLPMKCGPPTTAQLADGAKPTPDERQTLNDLYRDWITPCRKAMIDGAVATLPPCITRRCAMPSASASGNGSGSSGSRCRGRRSARMSAAG
jgi:type II secretory pathway pseudopilin PulG